MGVVSSIVMVKEKLEDKVNTCMLLDYARNNNGVTYRMSNICTKHIILSRELIWLNKTYGEYVPRKQNSKADYFIQQNEYAFYEWAHVKIDPDKKEVKTENVKNEENVKTKQKSNKEEDVQKTTKIFSFNK